MRVLLQRVRSGSVSVDGRVVGRIDHGVVLLVGVGEGDTEAAAIGLAGKIVGLRIFNDEAGRFDRSLLDVGAGALVVSQFTLYADARRGRRPSFTGAARPEVAEPLVEVFAGALRDTGVRRVEMGVFGAMMAVELCNDGPVTIWLDSVELGM